ncbi:MAG TPA: hypothetical protein V6D08_02050 [Candidatus Obscuribacterales bacterium]
MTAGTFFDHMRTPRAWMAAMWLIGHGVLISSVAFHKLVGITQSSAHNLLTKIRMAIQSEMPHDCLAISSRVFSEIFTQRSRQTPARSHPRAEQEEFDTQEFERSAGAVCGQGGEEGRDASDRVPVPSNLPVPPAYPEEQLHTARKTESSAGQPGDNLSPEEHRVYELLKGQDLACDELIQQTGFPAGAVSATLVLLEMAGLVERLPGAVYTRRNGTASESLPAQPAEIEALSSDDKKAVDSFKKTIRRVFFGVSRKLLQPYLAAFWCYMDRARWSADALFSTCIRAGPLSYKDMLEYVSPPLVKLRLQGAHYTGTHLVKVEACPYAQ